jgi:site-specific DNA recombinase
LRGLVECGHCQVGCNCHKMRGRNGAVHRYYYCRNHDPLRAGGEDRRCPERNIRANELDAFVFDQVRRALLEPDQLVAGERALLAGAPQSDGELIAAQLDRLERRLAQADQERERLLDAYQAGLIALDELTRRSKQVAARREELAAEQTALRERHTEPPARTDSGAAWPASPSV